MKIPIVDGQLNYFPELFSATESQHLYERLKNNLAWRSDKIRLFGKEHKVPRLQAWYGDKGVDYYYSGLKLTALAWTDELQLIKERCEQRCKTLRILEENEHFNGVLVNYYRDQHDTVGWHSDNEVVLGENPVIASVTLGTPRKFMLKHKISKQKQPLQLESGSLLIMSGAIQHHWLHALPRTKQVKAGRINLSFRIING